MDRKKYHIIACHVLWRELCYYAAQSEDVFTFHFLEQGLHDTPDELRKKLQVAVNQTDESCDAILIGYGLCSNGVVGIRAHNVPLVVMRGHDCITFFLGSKERYREFFDANPGTYWYTPGWIETGKHPMPGKERLDMLLHEYGEKYGEDNAQYLMEMEQQWIREYKTAAYTDLGVGDRKKCKAYTRECAEYLNWRYTELAGDASLLQDFLNGTWNNDRFLTVPPHHEIIASHDEKILHSKPCEDDANKPEN